MIGKTKIGPRTPPPPWVTRILLTLGVIACLALTPHVPFLYAIYTKNSGNYMFAVVTAAIGIWGLALFQRRDDTPEFRREIRDFLLALGGLGYFAYLVFF